MSKSKRRLRPIRELICAVLIFAGFSSLSSAESPLKWEDCLREAAHNHPDLIAAQELVVQSQADKKSIISGALPQFTADLNASTVDLSTTGSTNVFGYGVSGSLLLFDGFKTLRNISASSEKIKAAGENFRFASASVRFALREAFVDLLKAQELIVLTEEIYHLRKSNLELIALRYESGTEHKGALLTAKASVSQSLFDIENAKRGLMRAQKKLSKELGRDQFSFLQVQGDFNIVLDLNAVPDFEKIAQNNPVFLQIVAQKNAAVFDVQSSKGDFLPSVVLNAKAQEEDRHWLPEESGTSATVKVSVPLFSGGANVARLSKAQSVLRRLIQQERSQKQAIIYALEESWANFADAFENISVQRDFLAAYQERAKIAQAQYSTGLISFDNWTIIQDDLVGAQKRFLETQASALLAEARWIQAKGERLEYEN